MQLSKLLNLSWRIGSKIATKLRGVIYSYLVKASGGKCGVGLCIQRGVTFKYAPHSGITIGDNVHIGERSFLDIPPGARLFLGDHAYIGIGVVVAANDHISIGKSTLIGEYTSIRDSNHSTSSLETIKSQSNKSEPLLIGEDVWIGRGSAILKGASIGNRSIIAANSVVITKIPSSVMAAGSPAKIKKNR